MEDIKMRIYTLKDVPELAEKLHNQKKQVVFTNGCFDILHMGHILSLEKARKLGDCLVVGLNSDSSVRQLKAPPRPIFEESQRAYILASLRFVDYVVVFSDSTPIEIIKSLRPEVLVKGGDWQKQDIVGRDFVESYGGRVETVDYQEGLSTTSLINKIKKSSA